MYRGRKIQFNSIVYGAWLISPAPESSRGDISLDGIPFWTDDKKEQDCWKKAPNTGHVRVYKIHIHRIPLTRGWSSPGTAVSIFAGLWCHTQNGMSQNKSTLCAGALRWDQQGNIERGNQANLSFISRESDLWWVSFVLTLSMTLMEQLSFDSANTPTETECSPKSPEWLQHQRLIGLRKMREHLHSISVP